MTQHRALRHATLPALAALAVPLAAAAAPTAVTQNGTVTGIVAQDMREFLGIRYAAPPVGDLPKATWRAITASWTSNSLWIGCGATSLASAATRTR